VDVVCCSVPEAAAQLDSGEIRVLAVFAAERLADFPDYPTAREQKVDYEAIGWRGIMLPKGTPSEIATLLSDKLAEIGQSAEFQQFMKKNGFTTVIRGPNEFKAYLQEQDTKWGEVIKSAGYETLGYNQDPGPKAIPLFVTAALILCLVLEGFLSRRRAAGPAANGAIRLSATAWFALVGLALYLILMPWIGFAVSTLAFTFAMMWRLGTRWWLGLAASIIIVLTIHLLFVTLFKVQLP
jgi:hypothetical protein